MGMGAAGEYLVGDRDKGLAICNQLNIEHCRRMNADAKIIEKSVKKTL